MTSHQVPLANAAGEEAGHVLLARDLRAAIRSEAFGEEGRLPTEADLVAQYGLSRHTVRRAFVDLVNEGLVYRVAGRGTFVTPPEERYVHRCSSVEELFTMSRDSTLEIIEPFRRTIDVTAAGRLRLDSDVVWTGRIRRVHDGIPFVCTTLHLPPPVGPALVALLDAAPPGEVDTTTMIELVEQGTGRRAVEVDQSITVDGIEAGMAAYVNLEPHQTVMRIDRLYLDEDDEPIQLGISFFHPEHYSFRLRLHRHTG